MPRWALPVLAAAEAGLPLLWPRQAGNTACRGGGLPSVPSAAPSAPCVHLVHPRLAG